MSVSLINAQMYPFMCNFVPKDAQRLHGGYHNYFSAFAYVQHLLSFWYSMWSIQPNKKWQHCSGRSSFQLQFCFCATKRYLEQQIHSIFIHQRYKINSCNIYSNIVALHVTRFFFVLFYHWSDQITGNQNYLRNAEEWNCLWVPHVRPGVRLWQGN